MKKFLVVLLALAMILAIASTAMAADTKIPDYNDTKTSTEYANDIYRLTALGVLEGNTGWGGAYRPADNLTRAEFAKIACFMFGKQSQVNYYKAQPSAFSDVEEGFWAEGWINCANDNGLMIGVGGGKFAPQANVTKQEVATVVLRAVGYTDELPGAWPADYIAKSQKVYAPFASETLFDYVEIIDGTAATRAEMAAIVNYALDLYRVAPAGNQLIVNGISDADADGYLYKALKTNEANIYNFFLGVDIKGAEIEIPIGPAKVKIGVDPNLTTRETLLWDVFHAIEIPYVFERWEAGYGDNENMQYVEASGWGFENLKKCELVFQDELIGVNVPVATNYYIFDDCLDGELWQVGDRLANLTVQINVSKINLSKYSTRTNPRPIIAGAEAVYAEMLSDVTYIDEKTKVEDWNGDERDVDNADVFSLDLDGFIGANLNGNYDLYDYDWFEEDEIAIVKEVSDSKVTVDNKSFGDAKEAGVFCYLGDDCKKKHDQQYVFLKDGKLQDASCLKVDDVLYKAGYLADEKVVLYIAYTPKASKLDEMSNDKKHLFMDGEEFWYCDNGFAHEVSYNGGYAGKNGKYEAINYAKLKDKLGEECLFTPGYGKKYVATIIFAAKSSNIKYGVLTDLEATHIKGDPDNFFAEAATIFGVNGEENEPTYDLSQKVCIGYENKEGKNPDIGYTGDKYLGYLGNFELNNKDQIKLVDDSFGAIGDTETLIDPAKSKLGAPNGDDTGFVPFAPQDEPITVVTTSKGFLNNASVKAIDDMNAAIEGKVTDYGKHPAKSMKITESTIVYEVTAESETEGDTTTWSFDEVKLGDPADYIDAEFSCDQFSIFAWDGNEITVLYVVNPAFHGDIIMGLFDTDHSTADGDFVKYLEDGTMVEIDNADDYEALTDHKLIYAIYKTKDDVAEEVYMNGESLTDLKAGDFAVLITAFGFQPDKKNPTAAYSIDRDDAKALIIANTEDAVRVTNRRQINFVFLDESDFQEHCDADTTEFIDMTGEGGFDYDSLIADANHQDGSDSDYSYIFVLDDANNVLKVFRCYKDGVELEPYSGTSTNDDFATIWGY